jgi:hypothetical protein
VFTCGPTKDDQDLADAQVCKPGSDFKITLLLSCREADKTTAVAPKSFIKKNWWKDLPGQNYETEAEAATKRVDVLKAMHSDPDVLKNAEAPDLNPFKIVEMYSNFRPLVPVEYQTNEIYREPTDEEWAVVKKDKTMNKENKLEKKKMKKEAKEEAAAAADSRKAKKPRTTPPDDKSGMVSATLFRINCNL